MSCPVEDGYYLLHSVPRLGKVNDSRGVRVSLTCTPVLMRLLGKYLPVKILDSGWDHPLPAPFNVIRGSLTINTFVKYNVNFFRSAPPPPSQRIGWHVSSFCGWCWSEFHVSWRGEVWAVLGGTWCIYSVLLIYLWSYYMLQYKVYMSACMLNMVLLEACYTMTL